MHVNIENFGMQPMFSLIFIKKNIFYDFAIWHIQCALESSVLKLLIHILCRMKARCLLNTINITECLWGLYWPSYIDICEDTPIWLIKIWNKCFYHKKIIQECILLFILVVLHVRKIVNKSLTILGYHKGSYWGILKIIPR